MANEFVMADCIGATEFWTEWDKTHGVTRSISDVRDHGVRMALSESNQTGAEAWSDLTSEDPIYKEYRKLLDSLIKLIGNFRYNLVGVHYGLILHCLGDFAETETGKAPDDNVFAQAGIVLFDELADGLIGIFNERLVQ